MPPASRGSRRDFAALEARRYEAARLFARGASQVTVARTLGVTRAAAHRWYHDTALLLSLGVIDPRVESVLGLKGVPSDEELRGWVSRLLVALGREGCAS